VANVQSALIEGALLTVLVVFLFLNSWRSTVITGLALPVSVLASFIAVMALAAQHDVAARPLAGHRHPD
jgi:HAE1 family hydrophobic/amphiphilic exporter-1